MTEKKKRADRFVHTAGYICIFCVLIAILGHLGFMKLGTRPLESYDESRHGANAFEMCQTGEPLITTYQYKADVWNAKPPLSTWLIASSFKLFGASAFSLRIYSTISLILCTIIVSLYALKRFGRLESLFVLLLTAAIPYGYLAMPHFFRYGDADMLYVLFFTIAMLFMLESRRSVRMYYGCAAFFVLAFFTKSLHAFVIPAACLVNALFCGDLKRLRLKNYLMFILIGFVPIAVWAILRAQRTGGMDFFITMLRNDLSRAAKVVENHTGSVFFYISYMEKLFPITIGCAGIAAIAAMRKNTRPGRMTIGILAWFFTPLMLYSICKSKLTWYIYPVTFAMILPASVFYGRILRRAPKNLFAAVVSIMILLFCADMVKDNAAHINPLSGGETAHERTLDLLADAGIDQTAPLYIEDPHGTIDELGEYALQQNAVLQMYFDGWTHPTNGGAAAYLKCDTKGALLLMHKASDNAFHIPEDGYTRTEVDADYILYTHIAAD